MLCWSPSPAVSQSGTNTWWTPETTRCPSPLDHVTTNRKSACASTCSTSSPKLYVAFISLITSWACFFGGSTTRSSSSHNSWVVSWLWNSLCLSVWYFDAQHGGRFIQMRQHTVVGILVSWNLPWEWTALWLFYDLQQWQTMLNM